MVKRLVTIEVETDDDFPEGVVFAQFVAGILRHHADDLMRWDHPPSKRAVGEYAIDGVTVRWVARYGDEAAGFGTK